MRRKALRLLSAAWLVLTLASCGGGGGGSSAAPTPAPMVPSPPPSVPAPNRPPILGTNFASFLKVSARLPLHYDASQGGQLFRDPDGDSLTYSLQWDDKSVDGPWLSLPPVSLAEISNPPGAFLQIVRLTVIARDGRGGEARHLILIERPGNQPPAVVKPNLAVFPGTGEPVSHDLSQAGTTFADPDGDPLTYSVEMTTPAGRGFRVEGIYALGALGSTDIAQFKITASDGFGTFATDVFVVAKAGPLPGKPTLPATSFVYEDASLSLPWEFRKSIALDPFWDTAFTSNGSGPPTNATATLGRVLFYDKRLSITNTHSCGSCHVQSHGFATAERSPTGVLGIPLKRNAMALANTRYNFRERWFSDSRAFSLESLVLMPIEDPTELGNLLPLVEKKLAETDFYPPLFAAAFGTPEITSERIARALAKFLRSVITYRSRFDQAYLRMEPPPALAPDATQFLTATELRGAELFAASRCAVCHRTELQIDAHANNGLDAIPLDPGDSERSFRAASLRNIAVTAPYMHDGRFATLREVIDHYDHGVVDSPFVSTVLRESDNGPIRRLFLSELDKNALETFLGTLTDSAMLTDPKFADPF